jgi:transposase
MDGFTVRRAQMILMSAEEGVKVEAIGWRLGCSGQAVRAAIHAFHAQGTACLYRRSRARRDDQRAFDDAARVRLHEMVHQPPRAWGGETSLWTLALLAEVSHREGLTARRVSIETVRETLAQLGIRWGRAKHWIASPDARYGAKKSGATG